MDNENKNNKYQNIIILLIGLLLILLSALLNTMLLTPEFKESYSNLSIFLTIMSSICSAIGVSLTVGFITLKVRDINEPFDPLKVKDDATKSKIIKELSLVDNNFINKYNEKILNELMTEDSRYRENMTYDVRVFIKGNTVYAETTSTYDEYNHKENEIKTYFDQENSHVKYYKFINPDDTNDSNVVSDIEKNSSKAHGDSLEYVEQCQIPAKYMQKPYLKIEKKYEFVGGDHWITYGLLFACPTTSIKFNLTAEDGLKIKEVTIFGDNTLYTKTENSEHTQISLTSNQWLSHSNGFLILVSNT